MNFPAGEKGFGAENEMTEELTANFVNLFCHSRSHYSSLRSGSYNFNMTKEQTIHNINNSKTNNERPRLYLFSYLPYALILEAFLSYIPYLIYVTKTKSMIQPVLAEAADMALLTSG